MNEIKKSADIILKTAKRLLDDGRFEEAEKLILENTADKTKEGKLLLFKLSYSQERYQEAIHRGEALLLSGYKGDAEFYFTLGMAYIWLEENRTEAA